MKKTDYIGFFDSGLGGLSVLKHALQVFPEENYIFFADCGHFPYGEKTPEQVREYSIASCDRMYEKGIKALVIAKVLVLLITPFLICVHLSWSWVSLSIWSGRVVLGSM